MEITAYKLAERFVGLREQGGAAVNHPQIMAMLQLDATWPADDETPWCSAFVNYIAWLLGLERSKKLSARSWLAVGEHLTEARVNVGFDIVILQRGDGAQPGPAVLDAPGHVGFFTQFARSGGVLLLAGNQSNAVSVAEFPRARVLGYRRLRIAG